ncbi:hypothetical protein SAMN02982929_00775 [Saccharopolyspora kobensis]|uniref:DUF7144 domain-containing protein n=1 Tax=Saccharopolyspora kobensis TaxID=146035 RepID=A0A1H5V634_9PSEU|nr:hypothetical protein [Saccharopolyspora kobensis]SEF82646.1 hypothetical protein SAMN02982929_00775 [Saccharopolyspora kobensis]SFC64962.1 hypothetical protein SAMN05216506_1011296 [Saccharopolyspora kobensis]
MAHAGHGGVHYPTARESWAGGVELFAAVMMIIVGMFHVIVGLTAILQSSYYVVTANYAFTFEVTAWGWVHLVLGVLIAITGIALTMGQSWARVVGMIIAGISALGNFLFIPYEPVWSLLIIAIDVAVIWALAVDLREGAQRRTVVEK